MVHCVYNNTGVCLSICLSNATSVLVLAQAQLVFLPRHFLAQPHRKHSPHTINWKLSCINTVLFSLSGTVCPVTKPAVKHKSRGLKKTTPCTAADETLVTK